MDLTTYAQSLMQHAGPGSRDLEQWAREAQRLVAWHAIRLVPLMPSLGDEEREQYVALLTAALASIDEHVPLIVPAAARAGMLAVADSQLEQLITSRTVLDNQAA